MVEFKDEETNTETTELLHPVDGKWRHIARVYYLNTGKLKLYTDGKLEKECFPGTLAIDPE